MPPSTCSTTSRRWSSGFPSTRPSPTSRAATHLFGPPAEIARAIRQRVRTELGLPISIGVARTKHLAKIASQVAKPDGLVVVDPATELAFLHDLPVELMWGVGPVTSARLADIGVHTIGQLAQTPGWSLERIVGRAVGEKLAALAWNRDPREIETHRRAHSAGAQSAFGKKPADEHGFPAGAASPRRPRRHPPARKIAAGPHRDGARSLRRSPLGHPLVHARRADLGDRRALPRSPRSWCAPRWRIIRGEDDLAAGDLRVAPREPLGFAA